MVVMYAVVIDHVLLVMSLLMPEKAHERTCILGRIQGGVAMLMTDASFYSEKLMRCAQPSRSREVDL